MAYVRALLILQFHLLRHTSTSGTLVACFIMGLVVTMALLLAGMLAALLYFLGAVWFPEQPRTMALLALNMLLFVYVIGWFWGIVIEVQRSDIIDIKKMLHFPVSLSLINAINFSVSLIGFTSLFFLGGAIGLVAGASRTHGHGLLSGLVAVVAFFLAASAWAYYVRGLMTLWMSNKRRRRLVLSILPLFFMAAGFLPMLLMNTFGDDGGGEELLRWMGEPGKVVWVERFSWILPTGWLALALSNSMALEGPVVAPIAALIGLGLLGYWLGYRVTVRYCFESATAAKNNARPRAARPPFTARSIPWLNQDTAALALAAFLSFIRHPHMRAMLLAPFGMMIFLAIANSRSALTGQSFGVPAIVVISPFFMFSAFFCNLFGMDPKGFRAVMMLPAPRHRVLMAYHLALFPLAGGMSAVFTLLGATFFGIGARTVVVCLLQVVQLFLLFSLAGTFVSIFAPFTIDRNAMRGQRSRPLLMTIVMPAVVAVLVLPTTTCLIIDGVETEWAFLGLPAGLALSTLLLAVTLLMYPFALRHAGDLLLLREQRILAALQKSVE